MLRRRLKGNLIANIFLFASNIVVQVGSLPIFLYFWSKNVYGEWLILYSIPGYMALADAGISSIAANEATMQLASGNVQAAKRTLHTAFGLLAAMSIILVLAAFVSNAFVPWRNVLNLRTVSSLDISRCIGILAIYTVAGMAQMYYLAVYRANDRFARCVYVIGFSRMAEVIGSAISLLLWNSFVGVAISITAVRLLAAGVMHLDASRFATIAGPGLRGFSWFEVKRTWQLSLGALAFPAGSAFYFQGMTLLVGRLLGPGQVVVLNAVRILTRSIPQIVAILKNSTVPEFAVLFGRSDMNRMRKLNQLSIEIAALISVPSALFLILAGPTIIGYWTHGALAVDRGLMILFLIGAVVNSLWNICAGFLTGINRHLQLAVFSCALSIGSLAVAYYIVPFLGLAGIAWAMIGCEGMMLVLAVEMSCRLLGQSVSQFLKDIFLFEQTSEALRRQLLVPKTRHSPEKR